VIVLLAHTLFIDWMLDINVPPVMRFLAVILLLSSAALIWTEFWSFPEPYDKQIFRAALLNERDGEWVSRNRQILAQDAARSSVNQYRVSGSRAQQTAPGEASPGSTENSHREQDTIEDSDSVRAKLSSHRP
jgi:hypothetical protein